MRKIVFFVCLDECVDGEINTQYHIIIISEADFLSFYGFEAFFGIKKLVRVYMMCDVVIVDFKTKSLGFHPK